MHPLFFKYVSIEKLRDTLKGSIKGSTVEVVGLAPSPFSLRLRGGGRSRARRGGEGWQGAGPGGEVGEGGEGRGRWEGREGRGMWRGAKPCKTSSDV